MRIKWEQVGSIDWLFNSLESSSVGITHAARNLTSLCTGLQIAPNHVRGVLCLPECAMAALFVKCRAPSPHLMDKIKSNQGKLCKCSRLLDKLSTEDRVSYMENLHDYLEWSAFITGTWGNVKWSGWNSLFLCRKHYACVWDPGRFGTGCSETQLLCRRCMLLTLPVKGLIFLFKNCTACWLTAGWPYSCSMYFLQFPKQKLR